MDAHPNNPIVVAVVVFVALFSCGTILAILRVYAVEPQYWLRNQSLRNLCGSHFTGFIFIFLGISFHIFFLTIWPRALWHLQTSKHSSVVCPDTTVPPHLFAPHNLQAKRPGPVPADLETPGTSKNKLWQIYDKFNSTVVFPWSPGWTHLEI